MFINNNLFISLILGVSLYFIGRKLSAVFARQVLFLGISMLLFILCIPGLSFITYYLHIISEPIWYIEFRSINGIEIILSMFGLYFGFISGNIHNNKNGRHLTMNIILLCATVVLISIPFIKPLTLPVGNLDDFENSWKDDVCLQSRSSTCGPASLATVFKYYGLNITEVSIAKAAFSCRTGTENWYLIRHARRSGFEVKCLSVAKLSDVPVPSIIGTNLGSVGHFITLLGKDNGQFTIGDSLVGRLVLSQDEFNKRYKFKNFAMYIWEKETNIR